MIAFKKATSAYKNADLDMRIASATPNELVTMLFNGAIECIQKAIHAISEKNNVLKSQQIAKSIQIIIYGLEANLDYESGGEIAQNFSVLYNHFSSALLEASIRNDISSLSDIKTLLTDIRDAWSSATQQKTKSKTDMNSHSL